MGNYVQIFFALINAFHTPKVFDTSDDTEKDKKMKERLKYNKLYETVQNRGLDSRAVLRWQDITDEPLLDFPNLTMEI